MVNRSISCPLSALISLALTACSLAPVYQRPEITTPETFREASVAADTALPWKPAETSVLAQAPWEIFDLPELPDLLAKLDSANASLAVARSRYDQAAALIAQARAGLYPTLNGNVSASKTRTGSTDPVTTDTVNLAIGWEADLWGRIRSSSDSNEASAAASAADWAGIRLTLQAQLAQALLSLRVVEAQRQLLVATVADYERYVQLTADRVRFGIASRADLAQAESQLRSAQAQSIDTGVQRAQLEHAIAVLVGELPSSFQLPSSTLGKTALRAPLRTGDANASLAGIHASILDQAPLLPEIPLSAPSILLERRPDIAAAERRAAAANAAVGVANAAFFPVLTLSDTFGRRSTVLGDLFTAPAHYWTLGAALAAPLFDGGLRQAQKNQAVAAWEQATASYRQTVLSAFQEVEDQLATLRILADEAKVQDEAVKAARTSAELTFAQYRAGTVGSLQVIITNNALLSAERTALDLHNRRLTAAVTLIRALGGGWSQTQQIVNR